MCKDLLAVNPNLRVTTGRSRVAAPVPAFVRVSDMDGAPELLLCGQTCGSLRLTCQGSP